MKRIYLDFENLTEVESKVVFDLEKKLKIDGGKLVATGYQFDTKTRDWTIELEEKMVQSQ